MYVNNPHSLEQLKENIRHEISAIPVQQLQRVSTNIFSRCEARLEAESIHFETHKIM
jgi:hypothetical protein